MFETWLSAVEAQACCRVEDIRVSQSMEWAVRHGVLGHRSGGFFSVVGLDWTSADGTSSQRPYFDQRPIGTLGFLIREREGRHELLVQAKIEPGNSPIAQLAPTCQATDSNVRQLHGGDAPPFADCFRPGAARTVYDVAHSEQGTRFFRKRNRNVLVRAEHDDAVPPTHRWLDVDRVLHSVGQSFLFNTDARSVLVCAPWTQLVSRVPFSRYHAGFGAELLVSAQSGSRHVSLDRLKASVRRARTEVEDPQPLPLADLASWEFTDDGLAAPDGEALRVRQIRVTVCGREVPAWDQPIFDSGSEGRVELVCGRLDGVLHFLFRAEAEPGLQEKIELRPTVVVEPGRLRSTASGQRCAGSVVAECRQSEEGGRFYRDMNRYRIVDIGVIEDAPEMAFWLTLGDIRQLLDEPGWLTNEARSALSLLLPWM